MKCGVGLVWFDARDREAGASLDLLAPKFWIFWIFWIFWRQFFGSLAKLKLNEILDHSIQLIPTYRRVS